MSAIEMRPIPGIRTVRRRFQEYQQAPSKSRKDARDAYFAAIQQWIKTPVPAFNRAIYIYCAEEIVSKKKPYKYYSEGIEALAQDYVTALSAFEKILADEKSGEDALKAQIEKVKKAYLAFVEPLADKIIEVNRLAL